jgi:succinate-semialdehyde dehydrogenase / glutarate-semialdehyde dehydrogenase
MIAEPPMTESSNYPGLHLFIGGRWREAASRATLPVINPATGNVVAELPVASDTDIEEALAAASANALTWRQVSAYDRAKIIRRAAQLLRERAPQIGSATTTEQGKPIAESTAEVLACADIFDWFAEESRRAYGRIVPSKHPAVRHLVIPQPIGPVAAFSPWNFPTTIPARKMAAALAAGCPVIIKPAEETPASGLALARALDDAGLPKGVLNVIFGRPEQVAEQLISSPIIRKVTFTGSTVVGKLLAQLAGKTMKRTTMELGGHAPVIVFDDADIDHAVRLLASSKFRNAGQICIAPTRFFLHERIHDEFIDKFVTAVNAIKVGPGLDPSSRMGPMANVRRIQTMKNLVTDAQQLGAKTVAGGSALTGPGNFWAPTVLTDVPDHALAMNQEPFGPLVVTQRFSGFEEVVAKANRLPFGLASYAFSRSAKTVAAIGEALEAGMVGINFVTLTGPETPFGGIKESGHGSEGGIEGLADYMQTKYIAEGY